MWRGSLRAVVALFNRLNGTDFPRDGVLGLDSAEVTQMWRDMGG